MAAFSYHCKWEHNTLTKSCPVYKTVNEVTFFLERLLEFCTCFVQWICMQLEILTTFCQIIIMMLTLKLWLFLFLIAWMLLFNETVKSIDEAKFIYSIKLTKKLQKQQDEWNLRNETWQSWNLCSTNSSDLTYCVVLLLFVLSQGYAIRMYIINPNFGWQLKLHECSFLMHRW